jgi:hypothetical protein
MTRAVRLYDGSSDEFICDAVLDRIAGKLSAAYSSILRGEAPRSEVQSWRNSSRALSSIFEKGKFRNHGLLFGIVFRREEA